MTERKSKLDPDTKNRLVMMLSVVIMLSVVVSLVLIVLTYFEREEIIADLELAKNATQTVVFNFTGGNP